MTIGSFSSVYPCGGTTIFRTTNFIGSGSRRVEVLAVRPHTDDEISRPGGILARYSAPSIRSRVVTCTRGEEWEIHDPDLDQEVDRSGLRELRAQEVKNACAILGVPELRMLGFRDSGIADTPANQHPEVFVKADLVEETRRLVRVIRKFRPRVMVADPPGWSYPHTDHIMCYGTTNTDSALAGIKGAFRESGPHWRPDKSYVVALVDG